MPSPRPGRDLDPQIARRQVLQDLLDQAEALLDLANAQPHPGVDVTLGQDRDFELQLVVGRIAGGAAGIERAPAARPT